MVRVFFVDNDCLDSSVIDNTLLCATANAYGSFVCGMNLLKCRIFFQEVVEFFLFTFCVISRYVIIFCEVYRMFTYLGVFGVFFRVW